MAVELTANAVQTVQYGQNVLFTDTPVRCNKGYVVHRDGSGIVTLRGITCGNCFARYQVTFGGNIAAVGAVEPISLAIAIDGEPITSTTMTITPAAVGEFFNVGRTTFVDVPRGCCVTIAVENVSITDTGTPVPIEVENANLVIERVA